MSRCIRAGHQLKGTLKGSGCGLPVLCTHGESAWSGFELPYGIASPGAVGSPTSPSLIHGSEALPVVDRSHVRRRFGDHQVGAESVAAAALRAERGGRRQPLQRIVPRARPRPNIAPRNRSIAPGLAGGRPGSVAREATERREAVQGSEREMHTPHIDVWCCGPSLGP